MKKLILTLAILFAITTTIFAKIILPSVFADNMVLQQKSKVAIWGWSDPGETVKIVASWNTNDTVKVKAAMMYLLGTGPKPEVYTLKNPVKVKKLILNFRGYCNGGA